MKKGMVFLAVMLFVVSSIFTNVITIGVSQIVEHPALNNVYEGLKEALSDLDGIEYDHQIAQGSFQNSILIAQKFREDVDIIVAISTPSAQAAANIIDRKPIVFSAVTDPVAAGLIFNMGKNDGNVVGISDMIPVELHMRLIKNYMPNMKKIGLIYNTGEVNSQRIVDLTNIHTKNLGLETIEITGTNVNELITGINSRGNEVDVFYIFTDNLVASSINMIADTLEKIGKPAISAEIDLAKVSSILGFGFDYRALGVETGKIVKKLINGGKIEEIESSFMPASALILYLNEARAASHGIKFPKELIDIADIID